MPSRNSTRLFNHASLGSNSAISHLTVVHRHLPVLLPRKSLDYALLGFSHLFENYYTSVNTQTLNRAGLSYAISL